MKRVFEHGDKEYTALEMVAKGLEMRSAKGYKYRVADTWLDFGSGMMWTTILANKGNGDCYQAICPRDWELAISCDPVKIKQAIDNTVNDKYNPDR